MGNSKGELRALFVVILLCLDGVLNVIYGIAAIGNNGVFHHPTHYILGSLNSWGWISVVIGVLEFVAAGSLLRARAFGRYFGMVLAAAAAVAALLDIQAEPYWSLAVVGLSIWIIHGLAMFHDPGRRADSDLIPAPTSANQLHPRQPV